MHTNSIVRCQFCGFESTLDDFELDFVNNDGYWCPDCDGHTYFDDKKNSQRKFTLLLEDDSKKHIKHCTPPVKIKFDKRLSILRYPGGKSKLIDYLYSKLQNHLMKITSAANKK